MPSPIHIDPQRFFGSIADAAAWVRLFDWLPDVYLYVKDVSGRFVAVNESRVRMQGVADESEIIGKTDLDIHPAYWGRRYQEEDRRVMNSGKEIPFQVWLVPDGNGQLAPFMSSKMPLKDASGDCIGIAGVMYRIGRSHGEMTGETRMDAALQYLQEHFDDPLTVAELADHVDLSVSQLHRRFKAKFHMSPSVYLRRIRVHEASRLLADTDRPIGDIGLATGFYDQSHFHRCFRQVMAVSPSEFRRQAT